ncbi:unnamed protein product [Closterium sp. NIES-54]
MQLVTDVSPFHRDRMASLILREGYVARLVALFRASEGAHDTPALHHLYRVFKGLVLLNDSQLFEELFAPDAIMDVIGALEYDPDVPCRQQHRASVQQQAVYREALPIPSAALLAKIHQTYRLGYIKVRLVLCCAVLVKAVNPVNPPHPQRCTAPRSTRHTASGTSRCALGDMKVRLVACCAVQ